MFNKKTKKKQKNKLIPRLIVSFFIAIACTQAISAFFLFNAPEFTYAAKKEINYNMQIDIPDSTGGSYTPDFSKKTTAPIAEYIKVIYKYATGAVGIVAAIVLMIGGVIWLTAGGNATSVGEAKAWIGASLTGLVLVMTSYLILYQVNPDLVNFEITDIGNVNKTTKQSTRLCEWVFPKYAQNLSLILPKNKTKGDENDCSINDKPKSKTVDHGSGSAGGETQLHPICICDKIPTECLPEAPYPEHCQPCNDCVETKIPVNDGKMVNKELSEKLDKVYERYNKWKITEAWPPTVIHSNICHDTGDCVDVNFDGSVTHNKTSVNYFRNFLIGVGLKPTYECSAVDCCKKVDLKNDKSECHQLSAITASHFSVYK